MSYKDSEVKFVGQPIFKQVLDLIPKNKFDSLVFKHQSDKYYKSFDSWTHTITMLFGVLSRCDSMSEVCAGMVGLQGKLNHIGLEKAPAKSTVGDGLRDRDNEFFKDLYFMLVKHYESVLSVSHLEGISFKNFFIFDSTTIRLFSQIMKGVGRNPKNDGKKKGGLKVHMLINAFSNTAVFTTISEAKLHDKNFLHHLILPKHSMIVFDRAYNHYFQFAKWTTEQINFVCRMKKNAVYELMNVVFEQVLNENQSGVLKEEHIHLKYKENKVEKTLCLRKVTYRDEKNRMYEFLSNNFDITADEIAFIYRKRWTIELLFKKLKQNFQLHYFYSETENGIKTQVWCTLIAQLLLMVEKVNSNVRM